MFPFPPTSTSEPFDLFSQEQALPDILVPRSYGAWRYCVEVKGGKATTAALLEERIATLSNGAQPEPRQGAQVHGPEHVARLYLWKHQAWSDFLCWVKPAQRH